MPVRTTLDESSVGADAMISVIGFGDLPESLAARLRPRVERLGYLGEFFQRTAHEPGGLGAFIDFTETSKDALPKRVVEVIALTMGTLASNRYELHQHERLAVRSGYGREWVDRVEALDPDNLDDPDEAIVQRYLIAADRHHGHDACALFAPIVERFGERAAIAVMFVAGRYLVHSLIANTLAITPPVPSIFEDGFGLDNANTLEGGTAGNEDLHPPSNAKDLS